MKNRKEKCLFVTLIILLLGIILISGYHLYEDARDISDSSLSSADRDADQLLTPIADELRYAKDVTLKKKVPQTDHQWHCFYIKNGMLYRDHKIIKGRQWYTRRYVGITFVAYIRSKSRIDFTVSLQRDGDDYQKRLSLRLLKFDLVNSIDKDSPVGEETYDLSLDSSLNQKKLKLYYYK